MISQDPTLGGREILQAGDGACSFVYLDIGSNDGATIQAFAKQQVEARLAETLRVAVGDAWHPTQACVYAFEPNPVHLHSLRAIVKEEGHRRRVASLTVYTGTAVGGPEQLAQPMWLVSTGGAKKVAAYLTTQRPASTQSAFARPVVTVELADWLREFIAPRHGLRPVVMRMDIEGSEFDVLSDLATSGVGRFMHLFLTLEWHRASKAQVLGPRELEHIRMLDRRFLHYRTRCYDGSCKFPPGAYGVNESTEAAAQGTLQGGLEKTLAYMLHRAGITYVDAYFTVNGTSRTAGRQKQPSAQTWSATQDRKSWFAHMPANSSWSVNGSTRDAV